MALTPVEIRHMTPGRSMFGYNAGATDRLLEEIAASFEDVWRERADLADKVEQLEADLVRYRELEALLRTTLVSAERASAEIEGAGSPRGGADPHRGARRGAGRPAQGDRGERAARRRVAAPARAAGGRARSGRSGRRRRRGAPGRGQAGAGQTWPGAEAARSPADTLGAWPPRHHTVAAARQPRCAQRRNRRAARRRVEGARHRRARARARERGGAPAARRHARVPRDALTLVSGHGGREKIVELTGIGPALVERRLTAAAAKDRRS